MRHLSLSLYHYFSNFHEEKLIKPPLLPPSLSLALFFISRAISRLVMSTNLFPMDTTIVRRSFHFHATRASFSRCNFPNGVRVSERLEDRASHPPVSSINSVPRNSARARYYTRVKVKPVDTRERLLRVMNLQTPHYSIITVEGRKFCRLQRAAANCARTLLLALSLPAPPRGKLITRSADIVRGDRHRSRPSLSSVSRRSKLSMFIIVRIELSLQRGRKLMANWCR